MLALTGARDHRTFGGRIRRAELGLAERAMARIVGAPEGDFLPRDEIHAWAAHIARALLSAPAATTT